MNSVTKAGIKYTAEQCELILDHSIVNHFCLLCHFKQLPFPVILFSIIVSCLL